MGGKYKCLLCLEVFLYERLSKSRLFWDIFKYGSVLKIPLKGLLCLEAIKNLCSRKKKKQLKTVKRSSNGERYFLFLRDL